MQVAFQSRPCPLRRRQDRVEILPYKFQSFQVLLTLPTHICVQEALTLRYRVIKPYLRCDIFYIPERRSNVGGFPQYEYLFFLIQVDSAKYPRVSSYTRIAALAGRFLSGVSSQLLTHFEVMDLRELNYITFAGS